MIKINHNGVQHTQAWQPQCDFGKFNIASYYISLFKLQNINAPINCLPHLPHLGQRWGNGRGYAKKIWPKGWGKCHMYLG